jgi:hypothetical protein
MTFATIVADPPWPYDNFHGPRATAAHRPEGFTTARAYKLFGKRL